MGNLYIRDSTLLMNKGHLNPIQFGLFFTVSGIIIQQIVTLSKYGHDALDICYP